MPGRHFMWGEHVVTRSENPVHYIRSKLPVVVSTYLPSTNDATPTSALPMGHMCHQTLPTLMPEIFLFFLARILFVWSHRVFAVAL